MRPSVPDLTVAMPPPGPLLRRLWDRLVLAGWSGALVALVVLSSLLGRRRFTHDLGVAAAGTLRIVDEPAFPAHEFFAAGRAFPCRVRHADDVYFDNAKLVLRGASVKFADAEVKSPLDLILNSGAINVTPTVREFLEFIPPTMKGRGDHYLPLFERHPVARRASELGVRRNPESYSRVHYYSQVPEGFVAGDGEPRLARYRLLPKAGGAESGLPSGADLAAFPNQARVQDDDRPRTYLVEEFNRRVHDHGVGYRLQLQLHEVSADDGVEVYNSGEEWDEATHPWHDLATIELDRPLGRAESCRTTFYLRNRPPSLPLLPARSIDDYNSINHVRAATGPGRTARRLAYKLFGLPAALPDPVAPEPVVKPGDER